MNFFVDLKIRVKLFIGFSIMILFMAGIGIGGYYGVKTIGKHLDEIFSARLPGINYLIQADRDLQQLLVAERSMIFANPKSDVFKELVDNYEQNLQQAQARIEKYKKLAVTPKEKELIRGYEAAKEDWIKVSKQVVDGRVANTRAGRRLALDLTLGNARKKFESVRSFLDQLIELNLEIAKNSHRNADSTFGRAVSVILTISLFGLIIGILMMLVISRGVTRPLAQVVSGLKEVARGDGDLTKRLDVTGKDEVGILADAFNTFIEKLHVMIRDISANLVRLTNASENLLGVSKDIVSGSVQASDKSKLVAAAAEEMSDNMNNIASSLEESSSNTSSVAGAAEEMNSTIGDIYNNAEHAREISNEAVSRVVESTQLMDELGEAAQSITQVVETIAEISEQVNLLSLNATIEAARAGEAGRGFAVVANEIKELAGQTSKASLNIKSKIVKIQDSSRLTIDGINRIKEVINQVDEIISTIAAAVNEQSSVTVNIVENINQASSGLENVNNNVNQSTVAAEDITKEIGEISQSANDMSGRSEAVRTSSNELAQIARELDNLIGRFKV